MMVHSSALLRLLTVLLVGLMVTGTAATGSAEQEPDESTPSPQWSESAGPDGPSPQTEDATLIVDAANAAETTATPENESADDTSPALGKSDDTKTAAKKERGNNLSTTRGKYLTHGQGSRGSRQVVDTDGDPSTDGYYAHEAVVRLRNRTTIQAFNARHGTEFIAGIPSAHLYLVELPAGRDAMQVEQELEDDPASIWAELNFSNRAPEGRPGYFFVSRGEEDEAAAPYAPELVGADVAQKCTTGSGVVVAVLDTGIDASHPMLQGRVLAGGWNALDDNGDTMDAGNGLDDNGNGYVDEMTGHGTHVAGIIAQVAPGAMILPVKVLDSDGVGDAFFLAAGIYYAIDHGARVINLSLGSTYDARVVHEAVVAAAKAGVLVVAAAGNGDRAQPVEYPAADRAAVAVAATDRNDHKSSFSNYGSIVALSAPGTRITSSFVGGREVTWSGTSMAAPFVSAAAALVFAEHPDWSPSDVRSALRTTADNIDQLNPDYVRELGTGRLDAAAAAGCK
jgi:subtilisin family serine protease